MTTRTMAMNMIDNGAERGIDRSSPLFASSWMALFLLLKKELESFRETPAGPTEDDSRSNAERSN